MTHQYLPSLYASVMLGDSRRARRLARRLFWQYNIPSYLLCDRPSLTSRLTPWIIVRRLPQEASDDICTLALRHLAAEIQTYDRQPILWNVEEVADILSADSLSRLECCYLIRSESDIRLLFDVETPFAQGDMTV